MLPLLKQNIAIIAKQKGFSVSRLEREAGLARNFINNLINSKEERSPNIDSIIKIAETLNVSIYNLIGKEPEHKDYNLPITHKEIFADVVNYLAKMVTSEANNSYTLEIFFKTVYEIYSYSVEKKCFDKDFADWFITHIESI